MGELGAYQDVDLKATYESWLKALKKKHEETGVCPVCGKGG